MILELTILGGIFYAGFKNLKKSRKVGTSLSIKQNQSKQTPEDETDQPLQKSGNTDMAGMKRFERNNIAALTGLGLSIAGFFYPPLNLLSIPFIVYAIKDIFNTAYQLAKEGKASVSTLLSLVIVGTFFIAGGVFIVSLIILIYIWTIKLTARITQTSRQNLVDIFEQHPKFVWVLVDNVEVSVPFNELQVNDVVVVHAGETIPADGVVVEGMASVDQHILTGEARPVERELKDEVFASTVVLSGKIYIKVEKAGEESTVAKITHILNRTVDFKSTTQLRSEKLSDDLVTPALIAGCVALPVLGFNGALAAINSHPKEKLGFVAPISILNYLNLASKQNILIKDGRSLELLSQVDTIIFDKTGTLTEEQPHVGSIHCCSSYSEDDILTYAAAAECKQNHPLAQAILQEAQKRQLTLPSIDDSEYQIGYGLIVVVAGQTIHVGSERFMAKVGMSIPNSLKQQQQLCHEEGYTLVMVAIDNQVSGAIELLPTVRPEVKAIIRRLKQRKNIKAIYIISGDHEIPTRKLAQDIGVDHYFAETLPENKASIIEQLQQDGHFICYIGDGINDSIALKKSQVSISLRGASTIATDTAQIVLMDEGLNHLNALFDLADDFNANMDTTFAVMLVPAVISVGGVFLLGFGIPQTIILNMVGLILGLGNAMIPALKQSDR
jgi:heavy metal translocating P-type ATPase